MKERPILFSGPMVRALLDGSKTQTRRVMSERHRYHFIEASGDLELCPYGAAGDRLYVRETFYCDNAFYPDGVGIDSMWRTVHGQRVAIPVEEQRAEMLAEDMYYRADGEPEFEGAEGKTPWRPSIHMPRWASRITLEVTGVRVERLQHCSEDDACAEGCPADATWALDWYRSLWDSLNASRGFAWADNPWVWVVEFKKVGA